jgi:hypothetical protein
MTTMAEFLLDNIPHHPKILRSSNCLNLRLPRHLQCKTCTTFLHDLVYNPKQKRRKSANKICERPWQERNSTGRSEEDRSAFALQWYIANSAVNIQGKKEAGSRELRGNQHILGGKLEHGCIFRRPTNANTTVVRTTTSKSVHTRRSEFEVHQEQEFSWRTRQHAMPCCSKFLWKGERKLQQG